MAPKKPSPSPIPIGNCEVRIAGKKLTCEANENSVHISFSKTSNVKISVCEDMMSKSHSKAEQKGEDYVFVVLNPKDADGGTQSYLEQVLEIYMRELPAMNFAANTGKQSTFLKKCVFNGKYCTLLLKLQGGSEEVVAATTYQIIPADTQYAEIPLAAVSSIYQLKGIGHAMYMELRKRLESVGIRSIFCWGDEESEGFWLKQGFIPVAEVDRKGRAGRLPIRADIRKALCFPGGSTLMVSHLHRLVEPESHGDGHNINQVTCRAENLQTDQPMQEGPSRVVNSCEELATIKDVHCSNMAIDSVSVGPAIDTNKCSCVQGTKRKVWESSSSLLKSKKVKGSHHVDCHLSSSFVSQDDKTVDISGSKSKDLVEVAPTEPFTCSTSKDEAQHRSICMASTFINKEIKSGGELYRILLMNIADDSKKTHLTKVIENLGGVVTSDGSSSSHVVTGQVRRTLNFCTALCSGAWIVSPNWLKESFRRGRFVDELSYVLHDEDYASKYRTELKSTILRARARPGSLVEGYTVSMAARVQPPINTLSAIVRSAGGNVICRLNKVTETSNTIYIASEDDMEEALSAAKRGIMTFSSEWLMNCIMKQELDLEAPQFAESL